MKLRIEDIRKSLSTVSTWLTFDDYTRFLNDERNKPASENSKVLTIELKAYTNKGRKLFNALSETLEDIALYRRNLRFAIERDKEIIKNRNAKII